MAFNSLDVQIGKQCKSFITKNVSSSINDVDVGLMKVKGIKSQNYYSNRIRVMVCEPRTIRWYVSHPIIFAQLNAIQRVRNTNGGGGGGQMGFVRQWWASNVEK